jgi:hypothetical protein
MKRRTPVSPRGATATIAIATGESHSRYCGLKTLLVRISRPVVVSMIQPTVSELIVAPRFRTKC